MKKPLPERRGQPPPSPREPPHGIPNPGTSSRLWVEGLHTWGGDPHEDGGGPMGGSDRGQWRGGTPKYLGGARRLQRDQTPPPFGVKIEPPLHPDPPPPPLQCCDTSGVTSPSAPPNCQGPQQGGSSVPAPPQLQWGGLSGWGGAGTPSTNCTQSGGGGVSVGAGGGRGPEFPEPAVLQ